MITFEHQRGIPFLCAKHSTDPVDGKFPETDEILSWAYVFEHRLGRCPHCRSQKLHTSALLNTRKNGNKYWVCRDCEKTFTMDKIQLIRIFDLAWIQTAEQHKGKGYAKEILEYLKTQCHRLNTQISATSEGGMEACKAAGMAEQGNILSWIKEGYERKES